jgi:hypothetical protein
VGIGAAIGVVLGVLLTRRDYGGFTTRKDRAKASWVSGSALFPLWLKWWKRGSAWLWSNWKRKKLTSSSCSDARVDHAFRCVWPDEPDGADYLGHRPAIPAQRHDRHHGGAPGTGVDWRYLDLRKARIHNLRHTRQELANDRQLLEDDKP